MWGAAAAWSAAIGYNAVKLARLKRKRVQFEETTVVPVLPQRPSPIGEGWTVASGDQWEGDFWWHKSALLAHAQVGSARVYEGWGDRHAQRICIKVALRGGQLYNDQSIWSRLSRAGGYARGGLPRLHAYLKPVGPEGEHEALACELCGPSLGHALQPGLALPPADVLLIGAEVLRLVEACHRHGFAHRDVTPSNLLRPLEQGAGWAGPLFLVDYGISERLPEAISNPTQRRSEIQDLSGTLRYATPHLRATPLGRRDDVLGACFVMLACATGGALPWEALVVKAEAAGKATCARARTARGRVAAAKIKLLRAAVEAEAVGAEAASEDAELKASVNAWEQLPCDALVRTALRRCFASAAVLGPTDVPPYAAMAEALLAARAQIPGGAREGEYRPRFGA